MIYVIFGPTCSGKSRCAIELSKHLKDAPIINADAFQIYKDMNIGTAKIDKFSYDYKRHYLLDIITPDKTFSVKEYQSIFRSTLNELLKENKDVIVVGGTGLYIKASLFDYKFVEENEKQDLSDLEIKTNIELKEMLDKLDIEASNKIHVNNRKRLIRAITMIRSSNTTKTEIINNQNHQLVYKDVEFYFINPEREELYYNINKRVDDMIANGLIDEVKNLISKYDLSDTSKQAIGYKEIIEHLENKISLDEAIELIKKRTRNYAKRQVTFFKNQFSYKEYQNANALIEEF